MTIDERIQQQDAPTVRVPATEALTQFRWILLGPDGKRAPFTGSYPDRATAERFASPGERPWRMRVVRPSGPFSDYLEPVPECEFDDCREPAFCEIRSDGPGGAEWFHACEKHAIQEANR